MPRTRKQESRAAEARTMPATQHRGKLHVDPRKIPDGVTYRWVRESLLNQPDNENVIDRQISGWAPVPADRHPELVPPPLPGYEGTVPQVIRRGGMLLCQKSSAVIKAERDELRKENADIMRDISWTGQADPNMPRTDFGSTVGFERVTAEPAFKDE